jgi:hypothetical protein
MTAFLLARDVAPQAPGASTPAEPEARLPGHRLAVANRAKLTECDRVS